MAKEPRRLRILFENDFFLIIDKPNGLAVQGGEGVKVSLDSILSQTYSPRPLLVHRLDKDTSGVILVAKTKEAASTAGALFAGGSREKGSGNAAIIKQYLGVCSGVPKPRQGVIKQKLDTLGERKAKSGGEKTMQESLTHYKVLSSHRFDSLSGAHGVLDVSLLELELGTGRMHQIRRHMAHVGNPLLGDDKYGDFSLNKKLRAAFKLKNLLLHAFRLVIPPSPPFLPEGLDITAPLPDYFSPFVNSHI
ncbi:MAG: RluA family pseudouridine synthase [Treponema sp.]|jgi:23S rRNA pseudouridine955/2504/2580 synthase|nr:RluA family pseudouridine synthase [Treponema sp.]